MGSSEDITTSRITLQNPSRVTIQISGTLEEAVTATPETYNA